MSDHQFPNLWIAIPDSSLSDEQTSRDKATKICQFARACAIFRVKKIYIYRDRSEKSSPKNLLLLKTVLRYLDTPQYLRKALFPLSKELAYSGVFHPLNTPHHQMFQQIKDIRSGDVRVGLIRNVNGRTYADVGLGELVLLERKKNQGIKINVKITATKPVLRGVEAENSDINKYWGYEVLQAGSLANLTQILPSNQVVFTSKRGREITNTDPEIVALKSSKDVLLVFGSPKKGVDEILASEGEKIKSSRMVVNMFPLQSTRTVRLEEAILGSLAIFNYILSKR